MKKFITVIAVIMLVTTLSLCLVACNSKPTPGTYKFSSIETIDEETGMVISMKVGEKYLGLISLSEDFVVLELKKDGSAIMKTYYSDEDAECKWGKIDGKYYLWFDEDKEDKVELKADGKTITLEMEGDKLVLEKKK